MALVADIDPVSTARGLDTWPCGLCVQVSDTAEPAPAVPAGEPSCSLHPSPIPSSPHRGDKVTIQRLHFSPPHGVFPLPASLLPSPSPILYAWHPLPSTPPSRREQAAHVKNTESPRTWLGAWHKPGLSQFHTEQRMEAHRICRLQDCLCPASFRVLLSPRATSW